MRDYILAGSVWMKGVYRCFFSLLCIYSVNTSVHAAEEGQAWLSSDIKFYQTGKSKFYFYLETRSNENGKKLQQYYFGPRFSYKLTDQWQIGTALKSINIRSNDGYDRRFRAELDVTYKDNLGKKATFDFRNRYEQFYEDGDFFMRRYRARMRYRYPISSPAINNIFASQEFIYANIDEWNLQQSRFIPLGVNFSLTQKSSLSIFYMHVTRHREDRADDISHVLGAALNF